MRNSFILKWICLAESYLYHYSCFFIFQACYYHIRQEKMNVN